MKKYLVSILFIFLTGCAASTMTPANNTTNNNSPDLNDYSTPLAPVHPTPNAQAAKMISPLVGQ